MYFSSLIPEMQKVSRIKGSFVLNSTFHSRRRRNLSLL